MRMRSPLSPTLPERSDGLHDVDRPAPVELRLPARPSELGRMRGWVSQAAVALGCDGRPFVPPSQRSAPTSDEGGRGFAFMAALTDELELVISPDATVVRLRKQRTAEAHAGDA